MAEHGIWLLGHFESVYDRHSRELTHDEREGYFMQHEFDALREENPDLHINIEHATTGFSVKKVERDKSGLTTCGFTPHHLLMPIEELKKKSWACHGQCMPIPKSQDDVDACREFATSGDPRAHLGDDTAPHLSKTKEGEFGKVANGCYLPHSLALYALAFEKAGALDERFVRFCSLNGPDTWGLPRPAGYDTVTLVRDEKYDIPAPTPVPEENDAVIPWGWTIQDDRFKIGLRLA
jgi:dihydroorotase